MTNFLFNSVGDSLLFFIIGTVFGSFSNVCIYRMPLEQSVWRPGRSYCPKCKYTIPWYLNIPLVGWIVLRGRCGNCSARISFRYPLTELIVGLAFLLIFNRYGWSWSTAEFCMMSWAMITASGIDIDHMILPDVFTLSGIVLGLFGAFFNPERVFLDAIIGVLMGGGFLFLVGEVFYRLRGYEGMGGGDIKLLGWIGAYMGWQSLAFTLFFSGFVGSIFTIIYLWVTKQDRDTPIPFGPFITGAALFYLFFDVRFFTNFFFPFSSGFQ